mmetsp:Transcript_22780/g.91261  ORF Transcript_22780/g.91261 Transcript_22780/m.91261 type:complete len:96 (+) Transcript_22780:243-530(+)
MLRMNEGQLFAPEFFESEDDKEEERVFNIHGLQVRIFACPDHMQMTASGAYRRVWPSSVALAEFVLSKVCSLIHGRSRLPESQVSFVHIFCTTGS